MSPKASLVLLKRGETPHLSVSRVFRTAAGNRVALVKYLQAKLDVRDRNLQTVARWSRTPLIPAAVLLTPSSSVKVVE